MNSDTQSPSLLLQPSFGKASPVYTIYFLYPISSKRIKVEVELLLFYLQWKETIKIFLYNKPYKVINFPEKYDIVFC